MVRKFYEKLKELGFEVQYTPGNCEYDSYEYYSISFEGYKDI